MPENPYQPPQEVGYVSPETAAWYRWLKDRTALILCAVLIFLVTMTVYVYIALRHRWR